MILHDAFKTELYKLYKKLNKWNKPLRNTNECTIFQSQILGYQWNFTLEKG